MQTAFRELANQFGTPFYLFDLDILSARVKMIREALGKEIGLCFAMKANPMLIGPLDAETDAFEVCSPGEFRLCERAGIRRKKIVLSGVYKEEPDIRRVLDQYGADGIFTAESEAQYLLLKRLAAEKKLTVSVLLRLTAGNQFGMDEAKIREIISENNPADGVRLIGLQLYGGTQKKKADRFQKELSTLDRFLSELKTDFGFDAELLEYGPGLGIRYFEKDAPVDEAALLRELKDALGGMRYRGKLVLEMGRFLAAPCGSYVTRISDVKVNNGTKYCITDGGIHHLNYYGQTLAMQVPLHAETGRDQTEPFDPAACAGAETVTVCGALCTSADVLVRSMALRDPQPGTLLSFENTGAYSVTEGIYLFLSRDLSAVLFYDGRNGAVLHRGRQATDPLNA